MRHQLKLHWQDLVTKVRNSGYRQAMIAGCLVYIGVLWAVGFFNLMSTLAFGLFAIFSVFSFWGFLQLMSVLERRSNTKKGE